ncbi:MAG TPA: ATP-dependent DNA helicase [Candidatus Angelobacter sp.]|nr:ATP-dependent DNA helicase [Candidatus Angelobacter sp.]
MTQFTPNSKQQQAIEHAHGPMLVLAGAGTGKTTVLVERIAWLIEQGHARPEEILGITFTDNAAEELQERVAKRLRRKAPAVRSKIWAGTFHAYCLGILKRAGQEFNLLLPEDVYVFLRQRVDQLELERFIRPADLGLFLEDLKNFFDRCHEELVGPEQFQQYVDSLRPGADLPRNCRSKDVDEVGADEIIARWKEIGRVYSNAMRLLERENMGTFGMMIRNAVRLLQSDKALLERERQKARFMLIDEFQDCNSSNIILAELLAGAEQNIFAVGDPDQAIYRFRGASSAAFEEFQKRFPQTAGVVLDENQRSRGNILKVAFAAIDENPPVQSLGERVKFQRAPLESGRDRRDQQEGRFVFDEPVEIVLNGSHEGEAAVIAEEIEQLRSQLRSGERSMAVLYRQHLQREDVMAELAARDIPFIVIGLNVLETAMARDLLAVAGAACNDNDAESLFRICALPRFNIPPDDLRTKLNAAAGQKSFRAVLLTLEPAGPVLAAVKEARQFVAQKGLSAEGALTWLVRKFELPEQDAVVQAILRFAADWKKKPLVREGSLQEFLEYLDYYQKGRGIIPLFTEAQMAELERQYPDAVQLMTVHSAKGLEFSHVWLLRVTSGAFPTYFKENLFEFPAALRSSIAVGDSKLVHEQEERRLFYVAITRSRDRLSIGSRPGKGKKDPTPPGFLRNLIGDRKLSGALRTRQSGGAASAKLPLEPSSVGQWMLLPPAFDKDAMKLSANAVQSYSTCPMKFKLERDWRIPGEAAAAMQFGFAMHTVLKNYYDPAPGAPQMSIEEAVAAFRSEFAKGYIDDPVQKKIYEDRGTVQLRAFLEASPRGSADVMATEHRFSFKLGAREIVGRIDRIDRLEDGAVRVIDYKTGTPKDRKFAEESLQLSIYAMAVQQMNLSPKELVLVNVQDASEASACRTAKQLSDAQQKIEEAAEGIGRGEFEPKTGQHCRWCDFQRLCPATEQRVFLPVKPLAAVR